MAGSRYKPVITPIDHQPVVVKMIMGQYGTKQHGYAVRMQDDMDVRCSISKLLTSDKTYRKVKQKVIFHAA